jgi:adenine/guanine phosphoribosyltransferase-like PRPP-binding protein
LARLSDIKTRVAAVELLSTLKKKYSYNELSSTLELSAPILSRYVRGHVLPSAARSERFIAAFRDKLLRKMVLDLVKVTPDGSYDIGSVITNVGLLKQIAKVVYSQFSLIPVEKVLTMEVDGIPIAVEIAGEFNASIAIARHEKEIAADDFYEQKAVYSPSTIKYLYLPKSSIAKGQTVLIVDDMIRSGTTIEALTRLAEKARAKVVGVFAIASIQNSIEKLRQRLGLTCPIESLVQLEQKARKYVY